eukprot:2482334-Pyramimonas_sp.AAC.1
MLSTENREHWGLGSARFLGQPRGLPRRAFRPPGGLQDALRGPPLGTSDVHVPGCTPEASQTNHAAIPG